MNDRALKKLTLCIENEFEEDVVIIFAEPSKQDLDQMISETRFFNLITDILWTKKEQGKGYDRSVHNKENENEGRRKGEDLWLELWYKEMARRQMEKGLKVVQDADTLEEAKEESMEPNLDNEYTVKDELGINFEVKAELPPYIDDDKGDYLDASNSDFPLILDAHSLLNGDEKLKKKKTKSASGEKRIRKQPKEKLPKNKEQKEKKPRKKRIFSHGKLFPCDVCGRVCKDMSILTTHLRVHTNEKPYSCDVCQRAFSNKYNMIVHKRIHTGEKPHFCDACGKVCTTKQNLVLHMRTHTGEKPFACDLCEKSFAQVSLLNYHKRVHTGEKPYSCQTCGKAFSKHWNLKVHQKVHRKTVLVQNCI